MTTKGVVWHVQALTSYLTKLRVKMSHQEKENGGKAEDILVGTWKASVQCLQPCKFILTSQAVELHRVMYLLFFCCTAGLVVIPHLYRLTPRSVLL